MEVYLPGYCYNQETDINIQGVTIHYFSCINVEPSDPFNLQNCWNLMHDLNVPRSRRIWYLQDDREKRYYASAHEFIGRDGEVWITVPEGKKAYHAGRSSWDGRSDCNTWMYGIELIGSASSGFEEVQYRQCAKRCAALMLEYNFPMSNIAGHEEIAPGRKKDPGIFNGNFDMEKLKDMIREELTP